MFYKFPISEQMLNYDFYAMKCVGFIIYNVHIMYIMIPKLSNHSSTGQ